MINKAKAKNGLDPVKAGVAGVTIMAAGAAAVVLSKKENRKKVGKVLKNIKAKGEVLRKEATSKLDKIIREEEKIHGRANKVLSKAKTVAKSKSDNKNAKARLTNSHSGGVATA